MVENGVAELLGVTESFRVFVVEVGDEVNDGCEDSVGVELGAWAELVGETGGLEGEERDELGLGGIDVDVFGVGVISGELEVNVIDFQYAWFGP